jgi:hypothetical protein
MTKILPILALSFLLMAENCETPPPPPPNAYCAGAVEKVDPPILDQILEALEAGLSKAWDTIVGGTPSVDRRSTVFVSIDGKGSCSGVVLGPHTVLTAGHCRGGTGWRVFLDRNVPSWATVTEALTHPDYIKYLADPTQVELGKADLMLLYTAEELPGPYPLDMYDSKWVNLCEGMIAQGWGQTEAVTEPNYVACPGGLTKCLRESPYTVTQEQERSIKTKQLTPGGICFGDSGGPLYAQVKGQPGLHLAGITSTTASLDCKVSSTHVKVSNFRQWIIQNFNGPVIEPTP